MALHSFLTLNKAWSFADTPVVTPVNSGARLKTTVLGAIGNKFEGPILHYTIESTNGTNVLDFLKILHEKAKVVTEDKLHIILDRHPAHCSRKHGVYEYLNSNFIPHMMPTGTPQVNAIEHFWSPFKSRFKKKLNENPNIKLN